MSLGFLFLVSLLICVDFIVLIVLFFGSPVFELGVSEFNLGFRVSSAVDREGLDCADSCLQLQVLFYFFNFLIGCLEMDPNFIGSSI